MSTVTNYKTLGANLSDICNTIKSQKNTNTIYRK